MLPLEERVPEELEVVDAAAVALEVELAFTEPLVVEIVLAIGRDEAVAGCPNLSLSLSLLDICVLPARSTPPRLRS